MRRRRTDRPEGGELIQRVRSADPLAPDLTSSEDVARLVDELACAVVRTGPAEPAVPAAGSVHRTATAQALGYSLTRAPGADEKPITAGRIDAGRTEAGRIGARGRRVVVAALVAVALLGTAAFTFGNDLIARTGMFGSPGMTENDTSEWLNTGASDFREVMESLQPNDIPLPAGRSWQPVIDNSVANGQREGALMQVTGVRAAFAFYAECVWDYEWLVARQAGDSGRVDRAVEVMGGMASWPIVIATDGGGVRDWLRNMADAAARGDEGPVRQNLAANCDADWIGATP
ncbi:hypothetical protein Ga0074812_10273 [Parafrankia irregularis]|uniref:Uncharacterized protein n=1 Tax=Parafrankia irregularis TaxID=795642 RepID=A0A0S4QHE8_9ACTN|nr:MULTISPECIES: hypothetical protein [Parafrankia]MBE3203281.1 hypothetical protein [Parafrankia sp. CH37]CUU54070.1 hypothetical protein Ga0074812_10273 [Parafrankia irregularis]